MENGKSAGGVKGRDGKSAGMGGLHFGEMPLIMCRYKFGVGGRGRGEG